MRSQYLDKMDIERERGITAKAQVVTLKYHSRRSNLSAKPIDTPGHVDFHMKSLALWLVGRSNAGCDAAMGVEAQTVVAVLWLLSKT